MKIHGSCPKGPYSFLEKQTCKQQLECNCQNVNLYTLQNVVRSEEPGIYLHLGQEVVRGPEKALQRR